jgi:hypothetical protein
VSNLIQTRAAIRLTLINAGRFPVPPTDERPRTQPIAVGWCLSSEKYVYAYREPRIAGLSFGPPQLAALLTLLRHPNCLPGLAALSLACACRLATGLLRRVSVNGSEIRCLMTSLLAAPQSRQ